MLRSRWGLGLLGATALAAACTGRLGELAGDTREPPLQCAEVAPGPSPIRRLSHREYDATVRDLLGTELQPSLKFPRDEQVQGFNNNAQILGVSQALSDAYMQAAEALSRDAAARLGAILSCDPGVDGEDACARSFIARFGKRAFRRPLEAREAARFFDLFASGRSRGGFQKGIQLVVHAALVSPFFLYRVELDPTAASSADDIVPLTPYELATRLSYLLWGSMPDQALFDAADSGRLVTRDDVAREARRLLDDPRAAALVADFNAQWLELGALGELAKDSAAYPGWSADVRALLAEETRRFAESVLRGDGRLETLLTANYTFLNKPLADFYGVKGPTGDAFERVELDPKRSAGLLSQGSFLAVHAHYGQTSPIARGKAIRERLLCEELPSPPANVDLTPPAPRPGSTERDALQKHASDPACTVCHRLMDPIGVGFEHYDAVGRWRDMEGGTPVDASGEVVANPAERGRTGDSSTGKFNGVSDLARKLAESEAVRSCFVTQWFRYGYGRSETQGDRCTLEALRLTFDQKDHDVRALLIALTQTDAFLYRRKAPSGGGAP